MIFPVNLYHFQLLLVDMLWKLLQTFLACIKHYLNCVQQHVYSNRLRWLYDNVVRHLHNRCFYISHYRLGFLSIHRAAEHFEHLQPNPVTVPTALQLFSCYDVLFLAPTGINQSAINNKNATPKNQTARGVNLV